MSALSFTGPADAPVVLVLGGISSSKDVTQWWRGFVGPRRPIDTWRFRVVGAEYSNVNSTRDQAGFLIEELGRAGIHEVHAVVGASYGGMVALALAELDPARFDHLVVISAAHESSATATAHRTLQRKVVELGVRAGLETDALTIARGMAIATYSTPDDLSARFGSPDPAERESEIDRFLTLAGVKYAKTTDAARFLSISKSLDLHRINPEAIETPVTIIAVIEDQLVPVSQEEELASRLGGPVELNLVSSIAGHDAFLEDQELIAPIVTRALESFAGVTI